MCYLYEFIFYYKNSIIILLYYWKGWNAHNIMYLKVKWAVNKLLWMVKLIRCFWNIIFKKTYAFGLAISFYYR